MTQTLKAHANTAGNRPVAELLVSTVAAVGEGAALILADITKAVYKAGQRREQLRHLARLDDHLLNDIGITRADVLKQMEKPAWPIA